MTWTIERPRRDEVDVVVEHLIAMLHAMRHHGGHEVAGDEVVRADFTRRVEDRMERDDCLYLVARSTGAAIEGLLEAGAYARPEVFAPESYLHIHAVHVDPGSRRRGIGRGLMLEALEWGRRRGCASVELNVLDANPARALYASLGLANLSVKMGARL